LPTDQADLFGDIETGPPAYVPNPQHIRNRLEDMLATMRAAKTWPWQPSTFAFYRDTVWPELCSELPDPAEAKRWRGVLAAEAKRLDEA
jgi:hypothetical protein